MIISHMLTSSFFSCGGGGMNHIEAGGACTSALLQVLYKHQPGSISWVECLRMMRAELNRMGYDQIPQLTSSRYIEVEKPMYIVPPNSGGRRRAILIGINYTGQQGQLSGTSCFLSIRFRLVGCLVILLPCMIFSGFLVWVVSLHTPVLVLARRMLVFLFSPKKWKHIRRYYYFIVRLPK
jgi:hypothetical protein